jgi:hypothetical protein
MLPILPSWLKQRQGKIEAAGENAISLKAPQQQETFLAVRQGDGGRWLAALRSTADGPDQAATEPLFRTPTEAWEAAFELYRNLVIY